MAENDASISDAIQILKFGGETLTAGIKTLKAGMKVPGWVFRKSALLKMKAKLALYHSSETTAEEFNMLSIKTMHKMTGGNYKTVNLPTEDKEKLARFFSHMKKLGLDCAVLPDLEPDNGYTQIAAVPEQAQRLEALMDIFDFETGRINKDGVKEENKGKFINFEDYWNSGRSDIKEQLVAEAVSEVEKEQEENQKKTDKPVKDEKTSKEELEKAAKIEKLRAKSQDKEHYYQVTIDKKMIIKEDDKTYLTRVPGSYDKNTDTSAMMAVNKSESMKVNNGKTIITFIPKEGETCIARKKRDGSVNKEMKNNKELYSKHYSEFKTDINKADKGKNKNVSIDKKRKKPGFNKH